jgi:hypothetical protein
MAFYWGKTSISGSFVSVTKKPTNDDDTIVEPTPTEPVTTTSSNKKESVLMDFYGLTCSYPNGNSSDASGCIVLGENDFEIKRTINFDNMFIENIALPTYTITFHSNVENSKVSYSYNDIGTVTGTCDADVELKVPQNVTLNYSVYADDYKAKRGSILMDSDQSVTVELEQAKTVEVDLSYPFENDDLDMSTLIDGSNFIVSSDKQAIMNGSNSYNVNNGVSYGYISFTTPAYESELSITYQISSEGNFDFGGIYLGTAVYRPSSNSIISGQTTDGNGKWLVSTSGAGSSTTVTSTLSAATTYYLGFSYAKDGSAHSNDDRFYITNIKFTAIL